LKAFLRASSLASAESDGFSVDDAAAILSDVVSEEVRMVMACPAEARSFGIS
jgi:hypothetical protein